MDNFNNVEEIIFFSYLIDEFHEVSKYIVDLKNIYIFGLKNEILKIELVPDKVDESKELLKYYVNKLLLKNYEKEINKKQYKLLRGCGKDFLKLKERQKDKPLLEIELSKIKYFNKKETKYFFKCYNHQKKVNDDKKDNNNEPIQELAELKQKIQKILEQPDSDVNEIKI